MKTITGVIHGNTIELKENPGVPEGEEVEISIRILNPSKAWGDGLRRCAGALAEEWSPEDDRILEEIQQQREASNNRALPE